MAPTQIRSYDVRLELRGGGRVTVRVAAVDAAEARAQALHFRPTAQVVRVQRSQYAVGLSHREARREYLAAQPARR